MNGRDSSPERVCAFTAPDLQRLFVALFVVHVVLVLWYSEHNSIANEGNARPYKGALPTGSPVSGRDSSPERVCALTAPDWQRLFVALFVIHVVS